VRNHAIGLNFIDVYFRTGLYPQALPGGLGMEGAGVVEAVGEGVTEVQVGDRVAYAGGRTAPTASCATCRPISWCKLPDGIDFETGGGDDAAGLDGAVPVPAHGAAEGRRHHPVPRGGRRRRADRLPVGAAMGVNLIGTVGSEEKAALATENGAHHVINYNTENLVQRVKEITKGAKVPVVYDSVGKDTFIGSLDCLQPLGTMVSFGNSSGPVPPFSLSELANRALAVHHAAVAAWPTARREDLEAAAKSLFGVVSSGKVKIEIALADQRLPALILLP
jgi:NADPH2:quinone reductase